MPITGLLEFTITIATKPIAAKVLFPACTRIGVRRVFATRKRLSGSGQEQTRHLHAPFRTCAAPRKSKTARGRLPGLACACAVHFARIPEKKAPRILVRRV